MSRDFLVIPQRPLPLPGEVARRLEARLSGEPGWPRSAEVEVVRLKAGEQEPVPLDEPFADGVYQVLVGGEGVAASFSVGPPNWEPDLSEDEIRDYYQEELDHGGVPRDRWPGILDLLAEHGYRNVHLASVGTRAREDRLVVKWLLVTFAELTDGWVIDLNRMFEPSDPSGAKAEAFARRTWEGDAR